MSHVQAYVRMLQQVLPASYAHSSQHHTLSAAFAVTAEQGVSAQVRVQPPGYAP